MFSCPRICVASTGGGCGKTLLSLGLARLWKNKGFIVKPFKKGPDYIDAAWLAAAAGQPATNLDPFFLTQDHLAGLFQASISKIQGQPVALLEGNRGLYDGLNETGDCSTAQVARAIACPILLSINCEKATRTVAALLNGLTSFEPGLEFAGVVLNRIGSARHEVSLRRAIEANTDLKVLGAMPRMQSNPLPERHMGLACEGTRQDAVLDEIASFVARYCDAGAILALACAAAPLAEPATLPAPVRASGPKAAIGIVKDEALWFYYPENIAALEASGCQISFLSLFDQGPENLKKWQNIDGLYLGGGFPEDFAAEISRSPWLAAIREYIESDMPVYAECGGMILLCDTLQAKGQAWKMAGVFPADAQWLPRPQGLGYVKAKVVAANPWYPAGLVMPGHEFHYTRLVWKKAPQNLALRLERGAGLYDCNGKAADGAFVRNAWGSWLHIFAPAVPEWAQAFARLAGSFHAGRN